MNNTFTSINSKSACCLAPTPPTRKRSNDMIRVTSMPARLTSNLTKHNNYIVFKKEDTLLPPMMALRSSTSLMLDHASRQRQVKTESMVRTRAHSSDVIPVVPIRFVSPIKEIKSHKARNFFSNTFNDQNKPLRMHISEEKHESDPESPMIRQPDVKANMFFKSLSLSSSRESDKVPSVSPFVALRTRRSATSILEAAQMGASEMSDSDFLQSRWSSSSSLTSVRHHESLSSSMEFFLMESSEDFIDTKSNSSLGNSKSHDSTGSLRAPTERGLNRSNSSLHLEDTMFKRWN